ncbi:DUF814 domain-containing protein [Candidatus Woesearchaeota archaeon]|nr:DUF814 domain-containing protein [Candidatus Woesearchaeota archaeon]
MQLVLDTTKSLEDNANIYFQKSKKAKSKLEGLKKALEISKKKIKEIENKELKKQNQKKYLEAPEKKWFMKFRWFTSSDGFLCIGGRDATTNEIIIKKHVDERDLVFHTDLAGSPFFVIKAEGKTIPKQTIEEASIATASFSRAWNQGFRTAEVYHITKDQVKKDLTLPKGAFMIYGKREYQTPVIKLFIGVNKDNYLECSPVKKDFELKQEGKKTDTAKSIQKKLMEKYNIKYPLDDIVQILPGDCSI